MYLAVSVSIALLAILSHSGVARAQDTRGPDTLADSNRVTEVVYRELFHDSALSPSEQAHAKQVIRGAFKTVMTLPEIEHCAKRELYRVTIARRDSVLLTMVRTAADSAEFVKRAAPMRPQGPCPYKQDSSD